MAKKSQFAELMTIDNKRRIYELMREGIKPAEIARQLDLTPQYVSRVQSEIFQYVNLDVEALADELVTLTMMRLEHMVGAHYGRAVGEWFLPQTDPDTEPIQGEPMIDSAKLIIQISKFQLEVADKIREERRKVQESQAKADNIGEYTQTITAKDDLYSIAQESAEEDWLNVPLEELYGNEENRPYVSNDRLERLEQAVQKISPDVFEDEDDG